MGDRYARIPSRAIGCRELSATDWHVLACIALHADAAGRAWPSMGTIAEMTGIRRKDVPRTIRRLEQLRLLQREPGGPTSSNIYSIALDDEAVSATARTGVRNSADNVSAIRGGLVSATLRTKQPIEQPTEQNHARRCPRAPVGAELDQDGASCEFGRFWAAYPHRGPHSDPRKPARVKFEVAVKRGVDPDAIIRGAENYRLVVERDGTNPRYVCQAVTWIGQERWDDHQEAPEPPRLRVGMN